MGAGKTTLGQLLADDLGRPFEDTDRYVETASGRTVDDFFVSGEEAEFRRLEAGAVAELVARGPIVIALGGGALMDERSRATLREKSVLVHLYVPWEELREHVPALVATRPLLRGRTLHEIHELYQRRLETYREAPIRVTVGRRSTAADLARLKRELGLR